MCQAMVRRWRLGGACWVLTVSVRLGVCRSKSRVYRLYSASMPCLLMRYSVVLYVRISVVERREGTVYKVEDENQA